MPRQFVANALDNNLGTDGLGDALVRRLQLTLTTYEKGDYVHRAGEDVTALYCIVEGWVTSVLDLPDGSRQLLDFFVPVDIIGFENISDTLSTSDFVAYEKTKLYRIPLSQFREAVSESMPTSLAILAHLSQKHGTLQRRICVFAYGSAPAKVAHFILGLMAKQVRNGYDDPTVIRLPLNQKDIAEALGMSHITVNRVFTRFGAQGLIEYERGRIHVLEPKRLAAEVEYFDGTDIPADEFG